MGAERSFCICVALLIANSDSLATLTQLLQQCNPKHIKISRLRLEYFCTGLHCKTVATNMSCVNPTYRGVGGGAYAAGGRNSMCINDSFLMAVVSPKFKSDGNKGLDFPGNCFLSISPPALCF
uniref:Uncharacterized protein n=1 Tax=Sphaerodactylus townsendi TaxID=933632 RepID=A0ACB8ENI2_9SAUR